MMEASVAIGRSDRALFGLSANATARDVNTAYRRLARLTHPDKNGSTEEAKENFQSVKTRYEALKARMEAPGC
jgi:DnaJ-class molecular chaperone